MKECKELKYGETGPQLLGKVFRTDVDCAVFDVGGEQACDESIRCDARVANCDRKCCETLDSDCIYCASKDALNQMEETQKVVQELSKLRQRSKLSNKRVSSIARELNELIKVMTTCVF